MTSSDGHAKRNWSWIKQKVNYNVNYKLHGIAVDTNQ